MMRAQLIPQSGQPSVSHRWLLLAVFAALVISGLLGMHSLSTSHSGLPNATVSMGTISTDAEHTHGASGTMNVDAGTGCPDCGASGSHHATIMACVLGLLVTLLLVCRAKPSLLGSRGQSIVAPFLRAAGTLQARPPSLIVLSISRT